MADIKVSWTRRTDQWNKPYNFVGNLLEYSHQEHADGNMGDKVTAKVYILKEYEIHKSA
jgi:hypothetical protein